MPRFNRTGPWGAGPGTGWGLGPCGAGMAWRRGRRRGRGINRGFNRFLGSPGFYPEDLPKKEELEILENEFGALQEELKDIKARINELKGKK